MNTLVTKTLGRVDYLPTFEAMQAFTQSRKSTTADELWLCEHPPTFTQGLAGSPSHLLNTGDIPVIQTDRGGQVTYHGPGQLMAYPLLDLKRAGYFVKEYVYRLEESVIRTLRHLDVTGHRVRSAPGIYVRLDAPQDHRALDTSDGATPSFRGLGKIAALGIKVSRHCSYHGLALNVAMDLEPFDRINPCGYAGLRTVDLRTLGALADVGALQSLLAERLAAQLPPDWLALVGDSAPMQALRELIRRVSSIEPTDASPAAPILILGETGTGKELVARHVHALSQRQGRPKDSLRNIIDTGEFVVNIVSVELARAMNFSQDDFIRTTEERHKRACQALWEELARRGEIYVPNAPSATVMNIARAIGPSPSWM